MTYIDIFSGAVEHFTDIPQEFIIEYIKDYAIANGKKGQLLEYIMNIEFPEFEAIVLLNNLKSSNIESVMTFFNNSLDVIVKEECRQAIVN